MSAMKAPIALCLLVGVAGISTRAGAQPMPYQPLGMLTTTAAAATYAPLASPTFTGTPQLPTACFSGTADCLLHTGGALAYQPSGTTVASISDAGLIAGTQIATIPLSSLGTADDTAVINAALAANGRVVLPAGTFNVCGVTIGAGNVLLGQGQALTTLKAKNACDADTVLTTGAESSFGGTTIGINGWTLAELTIDGNSSNQSGTGALISCLAVYGAKFNVQSTMLQNCYGYGFHSEWGWTGDTQYHGLEANIQNLTIYNSGMHGWLNNGPHDMHAEKIIIINSGVSTDNTWDGMYLGTLGQGQFIDFHAWTESGTSNLMAYSVSSSGNSVFTNSVFEGGRAWFQHRGPNDQIANSQFYAPFNTTNSPLIVFQSNNDIHQGNTYTAGSTSTYAIQIGITGTPALYNKILGSQFNGFGAYGVFDFVNDGGYNTINVTSYAASSGATSFAGTPSNSDLIDFEQTGTIIHFHSLQPTSMLTNYAVSANGFYAPAINAGGLFLTCSGTYSGGNLYLPQYPADKQRFAFASQCTISSFTLSSAGTTNLYGVPTTLTSAAPFAMGYDAGTNSWTRVQ